MSQFPHQSGKFPPDPRLRVLAGTKRSQFPHQSGKFPLAFICNSQPKVYRRNSLINRENFHSYIGYPNNIDLMSQFPHQSGKFPLLQAALKKEGFEGVAIPSSIGKISTLTKVLRLSMGDSLGVAIPSSIGKISTRSGAIFKWVMLWCRNSLINRENFHRTISLEAFSDDIVAIPSSIGKISTTWKKSPQDTENAGRNSLINRENFHRITFR